MVKLKKKLNKKSKINTILIDSVLST